MPCPRQDCPECGDRMIHQSNRGPDESSSEFGQWIHDHFGRKMHAADLDVVIFKLHTGVLRVLEHKPHGGKLSDSQKEILPLLAKSIQLLAATRLIHEQSGVFAVYSDDPHDWALVEQVAGWQLCPVWSPLKLSGEMWRGFIEGKVIHLAEDGT